METNQSHPSCQCNVICFFFFFNSNVIELWLLNPSEFFLLPYLTGCRPSLPGCHSTLRTSSDWTPRLVLAFESLAQLPNRDRRSPQHCILVIYMQQRLSGTHQIKTYTRGEQTKKIGFELYSWKK